MSRSDTKPSTSHSRPATTDARTYLNHFAVPAVSYGPRVRNIHGIDEAVEVESIVTGARVLTRFIARYFESEE